MKRPKSKRGGARPGAGRPKSPGAPRRNHTVRCTNAGWDWLRARAVGWPSVGKWADLGARLDRMGVHSYADD